VRHGNRTTGARALFTDADNVRGTGANADRASAAVDAAFGAAATFDYFTKAHGRNGILGDGRSHASGKREVIRIHEAVRLRQMRARHARGGGKPFSGHSAALEPDLGEFALSGSTNSPRSKKGRAFCGRKARGAGAQGAGAQGAGAQGAGAQGAGAQGAGAQGAGAQGAGAQGEARGREGRLTGIPPPGQDQPISL
jgi:hypothetical protein